MLNSPGFFDEYLSKVLVKDPFAPRQGLDLHLKKRLYFGFQIKNHHTGLFNNNFDIWEHCLREAFSTTLK